MYLKSEVLLIIVTGRSNSDRKEYLQVSSLSLT